MSLSYSCGSDDSGRNTRRPDRVRQVDSIASSDESRQRIRLVPSRRRHSDTNASKRNAPVSSSEGFRMTLSSDHRTHLHHIFYALCKDRKWSLGLPTSFDFGYLDADNRRVQARIVFDGNRPTILFHPLAFKECQGYLLKGLLHHELCHYILGVEVGHGPTFVNLEESWSDFFLFKSESSDFSRTLNRRKPRYVLSCESCGLKFERDTLPVGRMSCRGCCEKYSNGEYDDNYNLHIGVVSMSES
jgi:predicted SprT family Zn-dependent metalloprotease